MWKYVIPTLVAVVVIKIAFPKREDESRSRLPYVLAVPMLVYAYDWWKGGNVVGGGVVGGGVVSGGVVSGGVVGGGTDLSSSVLSSPFPLTSTTVA